MIMDDGRILGLDGRCINFKKQQKTLKKALKKGFFLWIKPIDKSKKTQYNVQAR